MAQRINRTKQIMKASRMGMKVLGKAGFRTSLGLILAVTALSTNPPLPPPAHGFQ